MYKNLKIEMMRAGVKGQDMAKALYLAPCTFSGRMTGKSDWQLQEMLTIKNDILKIEMCLEELFKWETN